MVVLAMGERHVGLDCFDIHFRHEGDFTEVALTLAVLVLQDVALALFTAQHLTRGSYFEPLGISFPRLGDTGIFGHRGGDGRGEAEFGKVFFTGNEEEVEPLQLPTLKSGSQKNSKYQKLKLS